MKKLLMILLAALIFLPSAVTAFAADAVSFALDTVECRKNRLVDIEMTAECNTKLSAALFSFSYDKSVLEFREATAPDGSKVVTNETDDRVRLSYLCEKGASVKAAPDLLQNMHRKTCFCFIFKPFDRADCIYPDTFFHPACKNACTKDKKSTEERMEQLP